MRSWIRGDVRSKASAALTMTVVLLAGCGLTPSLKAAEEPIAALSSLHGTVVEPPIPPPQQVLPDTTGRPFSVADEARRRVTLLFFGYTHCPDVCPSTMADLAAARRLLPSEIRAEVTVAFVTEDADRDTPAVLRSWLDRLDPAVVGLIGGNSASKRMLGQLYLPETGKNPTPEQPVTHSDDRGTAQAHRRNHGSYGVDHSGVVYAFTPKGRTVLYSGGTTADQYAADLGVLISDR